VNYSRYLEDTTEFQQSEEPCSFKAELSNSGADVNLCSGGEFSTSALHMAAVCRNLEIMDRLIEGGADLNVQDVNGFTPIICAVAKDNTEVALCLAGKGADVDIKGDSDVNGINFEQRICLLQDLVLKNYLQIVKRLIETGDDVNLCTGGPRNTSHLHKAAEKCNLEIMDCLIKAGADVNAQDYEDATPLVRAVISEKTSGNGQCPS
jgi:ankyrin repeat protein